MGRATAATSTTTPQAPPADTWASEDPLGETLHSFRLTGVVYARSHLTAPWGVEMPRMPECLLFHVVTEGSCLVEFDDGTSETLRPGEFGLIPRGEGHAIRSGAGVHAEPFFDLPIERISKRYEVLRYGGGGGRTTLICGAVCLDHPGARDLVELLPNLIHVKTWNTPHAEWMHSTLRLMAAEVSEQRPGGETIVTRLADVLVIQAIRAWLTEHTGAQTGWLGALRDERIGPAIALVHREPEKDWTVASLASSVSMSRSAFSARFTELVGESPMQYVTRWRMHVAGSWLREGDITAAECGTRLGYNSEAAFSRAFRRVMGQPPGAWSAGALKPG
ncbi:MAG: AraC family transcriptional regulator [Planctomycetota bacterium]